MRVQTEPSQPGTDCCFFSAFTRPPFLCPTCASCPRLQVRLPLCSWRGGGLPTPCISISLFNSSCGENLGARNDCRSLAGYTGVVRTSQLGTTGRLMARHTLWEGLLLRQGKLCCPWWGANHETEGAGRKFCSSNDLA